MGMTAQIRKVQFDPPPCRYGLGRSLDESLASVSDRLVSSLQKQGFQLAFRLDYAEKFSTAGAGSFSPYQVWGICHLQHMSRALAAEPTAGLLLPCHLVLFSTATEKTVVMIQDPSRLMDLLRHPVAIEAAIEIGDILERILEEL